MVQIYRSRDTSTVPVREKNLADGSNRERENYKISSDNTSAHLGEIDTRGAQDEEILINISEGDLSNQLDRLQSEFDLSGNDAQLLHDVFVQLVESMAEERGKNWSDEVTESVANLLISMFIQEQRQSKRTMSQ